MVRRARATAGPDARHLGRHSRYGMLYSMINYVHAHLHRPESGWDPVPREHAIKYAAGEWQAVNIESVLDQLEQWVGGFRGKRILDLGGGPGQYSIAFAKRGGQVTWHDVSRNYQSVVQEKAQAFSVADNIRYSLGYLDEAPDLLTEPYDLVFNRICWYYAFSDRSFAKAVYKMVRPGGFCYVDTPHSGVDRDQLSTPVRFRTWLNDRLAIKIGHPFPPHGRLARLFMRFPLKRLEVDYRSSSNDRIFFEKPAACS
jgi:2-polyprenyl-3-methyl-5-hydroxy-6-metoxy-1,4-benzoquinol methylase